MRKIMRDKIGAPLDIGDVVIYARSQGDQLHFGTIEAFTKTDFVKIRNNKTGRVSVNARYSGDILNIETLKESNPEYFI